MRISDWSSDVCSSDLVRLTDGTVADLPLEFSAVPSLRGAGGSSFVLSAGTPAREAAVHRITLGDDATVASDDVLRPARDLGLDPSWISRPQAISDRKSVVEGKSVSVRVEHGGRRNLKKKKKTNTTEKR